MYIDLLLLTHSIWVLCKYCFNLG